MPSSRASSSPKQRIPALLSRQGATGQIERNPYIKRLRLLLRSISVVQILKHRSFLRLSQYPKEPEAVVIELSEYTLETLRKDGEFILYRRQHRRQYTVYSRCDACLATPRVGHPQEDRA